MAKKKQPEKRWTKSAQLPVDIVVMASVYGSLTNRSVADVINDLGVREMLKNSLIEIDIDPEKVLAAYRDNAAD